MTADIETLTIDDLTEIRKSAKAVIESGVLNPHEKQHMWEVLTRIDGLVKEHVARGRQVPRAPLGHL